MSAMCLADRSGTKISLVASAGKDDELFALVKNNFASRESAQKTMCAQSIRANKAVVINITQADPGGFYGKKCIDCGIRSIAALPVILSDGTVGVLTLYAEDANFFNDEEMTLLTELVNDIAFAVSHIGKDGRLKYLAYYDELTGLANRNLFLERVGQYLRGAVSGRHRIAVLLIDLDRFKNINDSLGRPAGDALLKQVGGWLARNRGDINLVARLGSDHFAVVLPNVAPGRELARLLNEMLRAFVAHPFSMQDTVVRVSATVGVALFPNDGADAETLFRNAEAAQEGQSARQSVLVLHLRDDRCGGRQA
jgi:diguanylate cyclase (GGDEF)-like protein